MNIEDKVKLISWHVQNGTMQAAFYLCRKEQLRPIKFKIHDIEPKLMVVDAKDQVALRTNLYFPVLHVLVCTYLDFMKSERIVKIFCAENKCGIFFDESMKPASRKTMSNIMSIVSHAKPVEFHE